MESLKNSFKEAQQKIENSVDGVKHNTKPFLEPKAKPQPSLEERNRVSVETSLDGSTSPLTEAEIRKLIKKKFEKRLGKPYHMKSENTKKKNRANFSKCFTWLWSLVLFL